jgi:hypothetical protein
VGHQHHNIALNLLLNDSQTLIFTSFATKTVKRVKKGDLQEGIELTTEHYCDIELAHEGRLGSETGEIILFNT